MTIQGIKSRIQTLEMLSSKLLESINNLTSNSSSTEYLAAQVQKGLKNLNDKLILDSKF